MTYEDILKLTIQSTLNYCYVVSIIFGCIMIIPDLIRIAWKMIVMKMNISEIKNSEKKRRENRQEANKKGIIGTIMFLSALALLLGWKVAPVALDIAEKDYVIVEGTINKLSGTGTVGNGVYHGGAYIVTEDGEEIQVQFAPGISGGFPSGKFYATVVYSKRTHYLLDIYPNMTIEEALSTSDILKEYKDDLIYYDQGA